MAAMERDLLATVRTLRAGGLDAAAKLDDGLLEVRLGPYRRTFREPELRAAADWLAACARMNYPGSDFARLWRLLRRIAAQSVP